MDKKTILAFLLIGLVLILMRTKFYRNFVMPEQEFQQHQNFVDSSSVKKDSSLALRSLEVEKPVSSPVSKPKRDTTQETSEFASLFGTIDQEPGTDVVIETNNYIAHIDPMGAVISSYVLKNYDYNKEEQVQLIQDKGYGNLGLFFINDEDTIYTYDSVFQPEKREIFLTGETSSDSVRFIFKIDEDRQIVKTFKFYSDQYIIDFKVEIKSLVNQFDDNQYYLSWNSGLAYTELDYSNHISKEDISSAKAYVFQGGSKEELKLPDKPFVEDVRSNFTGTVDWAAIRTKYFAMVMIPDQEYSIEPILSGETSPIYNNSKLKDRVNKKFSITLKTLIPPTDTQFTSQNFRIYIGPLDYDRIKDYHPTLSKIMDFGFSLIRPFAKLVLKTFIFLHTFIPNYGIVLIVFSILVKILVYPLTKKSYVSMQRMQTLQPRLSELKEKHGKDPQRLNKETMKLYKESGVNPLSGCLPTLLQLPLLWAIFIVFRNTIELRDASFFWWIQDLSAPDTIFQLPFTIPFYGDLVNILPIFMGVTMFIQQKMTMKDPKQKAMVYFMPIFLTLIFNSFPSGLNLYYALFNLFSIIQQKWTPKKEAEEIAVQKSTQTKKTKGKSKPIKRR